MATLWNVYLVISSIAAISALAYILVSKRFTRLIRVGVIILFPFITYIGYNQYILYKKQKAFPKIEEIKDRAKINKLVMPFESESHIKEYLNGISKISKDRPIIITMPLIVQVRFTDPVNPTSPHAIFYILLKNEGNKKAVGINIKWDIIDNGNRITPPDEWNKIVGREEKPLALDPGQITGYLYGPEIGAYAASGIPKIELALRIDYKDEGGKEYSYYCRSQTNPKPKPKDSYLFDILEVK